MNYLQLCATSLYKIILSTHNTYRLIFDFFFLTGTSYLLFYKKNSYNVDLMKSSDFVGHPNYHRFVELF